MSYPQTSTTSPGEGLVFDAPSCGLQKTKAPPRGCKIPLFAAFIPQLLIMVIVCVVMILTFVDVYSSATDEAAKEWLTETISNLEFKVVDPLREAYVDIHNVKNVIEATGAFGRNSSQSALPDFNKFDAFYQACKSLIRAKNGRYGTCLQMFLHSEVYPNGETHPTNKLQVRPTAFTGCGESVCLSSSEQANATFQLNIFDAGWYAKYPDIMSHTVVNAIPGWRRINPTIFNDNNTNISLVVWGNSIDTDPLSGETYVSFPLQTPLLLDSNGYVMSWMTISVNVLRYLNEMVNATTITASHFAIVDLNLDVYLIANHPTFSGFDPGVRNESVADSFAYIRSPSLVPISETTEPHLKTAIAKLQARSATGSLSDALTTTAHVDLTSAEDIIISSMAIRKFSLNLGIVLVTEKELFRERIRNATSQVVIVSVLLFTLAVIVSIITVFAIRRPIVKTCVFVEEVGRLETGRSSAMTSRSVFSELASLQNSSAHMAELLGTLKGFVPQGVLQSASGPGSAGNSSPNPLGASTGSGSGDGGSHIITFDMSATTTQLDSSGLLDSATMERGGALTLNVDRVMNQEVNRFKSSAATMLIIQLAPGTSPTTTEFGAECQLFMDATIPHVLKSRGVIEVQRPDMVVAMFDRGVHVERAAKCAIMMNKSCRKRFLATTTVIHSGSFLSGTCGSRGRNAFVQYSPFLHSSMKILELCSSCFDRNCIVVTDKVAKSLPMNIVAIPVENLVGLSNSDGKTTSNGGLKSPTGEKASSVLLFQIFRVRTGKGTMLRNEALRMKTMFSSMSQGNFAEVLDPINGSTNCAEFSFHIRRMRAIAKDFTDNRHQDLSFRRHFVGWSLTSGQPMCDDVTASKIHPSPRNNDDDLTPNASSTGQTHNDSEDDSDDEDVGASEQVRRALDSRQAHDFETAHDDDDGGDAPLFAVAMPAPATADVAPVPQSAETTGFLQRSNSGGWSPDESFTDIRGNTWIRATDAKLIGQGAFSKVYLGMNGQGDMVALKCVDLNGVIGDTAILETEVAVLSAVDHPNVAAFISVAVQDTQLIMVLEYVAGGTLRSVISTYHKCLPRSAVKRFALDIVKGLHYLHENKIVHGDVKPENVLLGADSVCKLTDFGSAVENIAEKQKDVANLDVFDIRGTAPYMAPEVARGDLPSELSDIWSFGVLLHELVTGQLPWEHEPTAAKNQLRLMQGLATAAGAPGTLRPQLLDALVVEGGDDGGDRKMAVALMSACLQEDPTKRPRAKDLLHSSFLL